MDSLSIRETRDIRPPTIEIIRMAGADTIRHRITSEEETRVCVSGETTSARARVSIRPMPLSFFRGLEKKRKKKKRDACTKSIFAREREIMESATTQPSNPFSFGCRPHGQARAEGEGEGEGRGTQSYKAEAKQSSRSDLHAKAV